MISSAAACSASTACAILPERCVGHLLTEAVTVRMERDMLDALDGYIANSENPVVSRPEAVRQLLAKGLRLRLVGRKCRVTAGQRRDAQFARLMCRLPLNRR